MKEKRKVKRKRITKVIPDKIFCELWLAADKITEREEFLYRYMRIRSEKYIDFTKYEMDDVQVRKMLENIFNLSKLSVNELLKITGLKKSQFSYRFCIPIRTVEDWCSGKNKCAAYIRLMVIKSFNLLDLGPHIVVQCDDKRVISDKNEKMDELGKGNKISKSDRVIYQKKYRNEMNKAKEIEENCFEIKNINSYSDKDTQSDKSDHFDNFAYSDKSENADKENCINSAINNTGESKLVQSLNLDSDLSYEEVVLNKHDYTEEVETHEVTQSSISDDLDEYIDIKYKDLLENRLSKNKISTFEQEHVHYGNEEAQSILKTTDYLKDLMKRNK